MTGASWAPANQPKSPCPTLVVVGGTDVHKDVAKLTRSPPSILVATPGRLNLRAGSMDVIIDDGDHSARGNAHTLLARHT